MQQRVETIIQAYRDPLTEQTLQSLNAVKSVQVDEKEKSAQIQLVLGYPAQRFQREMAAALEAELRQKTELRSITIETTWNIRAHQTAQLQALAGVKNIIAVASGKGGVGKSTTAVNLALALMQEGARVGLLDADIYGPNQPQMLGAREQPVVQDGKLQPVVRYGLQTMSIGYLVDVKTAMIWRGPMVSQALRQLLQDTLWEQLDYLLIDLPPGTGDIQLTLAQKVPVTGAVIVTTPQQVAVADARKAITMFRKVNVPILGLVENMGVHVCSACGHEEAIFGTGGGAALAKEANVPLLGQLPLDQQIQAQTDSGHPPVVAEPEGKNAVSYRAIARRLAANLALQAVSYAAKFPKIVIEDR